MKSKVSNDSNITRIGPNRVFSPVEQRKPIITSIKQVNDGKFKKK